MRTPIDTMLTTVEPYEDDFEDSATTGWSNWGGTWAAANGVLVKTNYGGGNIVKRSADADRRSGLIRLSCMRREQRQSVAQHRPHQPLPVTPIFSVLQHAWGPGCLGL
jgi:hypothetical protein